MDQNKDSLWDLQNEARTLRSKLDELDKRLERFARVENNSPGHAHQSTPPALPVKTNHETPVSQAIPDTSPSSPGQIAQGSLPPPVPSSATKSDAHPLPSQSAGEPVHTDDFIQFRPSSSEGVAQKPEVPPVKQESFELQLGKHIIPAVGIIVLLTALVFAGSYVYKNIIHTIGPLGKVLAMYLLSGGLFGLGVWLEKKYEMVQNYARLLIGGACAAAYYTTYAAHYVENLRVIDSPVVGGLLLLAAAGFMIWQAARRESETLAIVAILLGFYTSSMNDIRLFTLLSNLILTGAAVGFILRYSWSRLSVLGVIGAFGSYFYWRFFAAPFPWSGSSPLGFEDFILGIAFLTCYWFLFLCAGLKKLVCPDDTAAPSPAFLTLNNAAYLGLVYLSCLGGYSHYFWIFAVTFGVVLIGLSFLIRFRLPGNEELEELFLAKGTGVFTLGLVDRLSGPSLSFTLAIESTVLLIYSSSRRMGVSRFFSYLLAFGAIIYGIEKIKHAEYIFGGALTAVLLYNAWWASRTYGKELSQKEGSIFQNLSLGGIYFTFLSALAVWMTLRGGLDMIWLAPALAVGAIVYVLLSHSLFTREISFGSHFLLFISLATWAVDYLDHPVNMIPWWNPLVLILITLGLCRYWQLNRPEEQVSGAGWQVIFSIYALGFIGVAYFGFAPHFSQGTWMALCAVIGVFLLAYSLLTRLWPLAVFSQIFIAVSVLKFLFLIDQGHPPFWLALVPLVLVAATGLSLQMYFAADQDKFSGKVGGGISLIYKGVAGLMAICWIFEYIDRPFQTLVFLVLAALSMALAQWLKRQFLFGYGFLLGMIGLLIYTFYIGHPAAADLLNLTALIVFLGQFELSKRLGWEQPKWRPLMIMSVLAGLLCVWQKWLYHVIAVNEWASMTTVFWSALAFVVFSAGMLCKERVYRLSGLAIMACALARALFVDIWGMGDIFRIFSLIALAVVLLAVGFIYNRYQDKIKEWL